MHGGARAACHVLHAQSRPAGTHSPLLLLLLRGSPAAAIARLLTACSGDGAGLLDVCVVPRMALVTACGMVQCPGDVGFGDLRILCEAPRGPVCTAL